MNTHESYVSLEVAKLLRKAGFRWECFQCWVVDDTSTTLDTRCTAAWDWNGITKNYSAPTLEVAQRWLREVKGVEVYAHVFYDTYDTSEGWDVYVYEVNHIIKQIEDWINSYDVYHSYEEAQEAGIMEALKMILERGE